MTKRKRNAGLGNMKKKGRYTKKHINMITNNNNIIDTLREDDSSNGNIILLNSDNTIDLIM